MATSLDKEKLKQIKELLENYADDCGSQAFYYEDTCVNCLRGNCSDCYTPLREEHKKCWHLMNYIDELLEDNKE